MAAFLFPQIYGPGAVLIPGFLALSLHLSDGIECGWRPDVNHRKPFTPMSGTSDHYSVLGVARDADAGSLRQAYHDLAMKWHPDKNPTNVDFAQARFQEILAAYETLSDPAKRAAYDRKLGQNDCPRREAPCGPTARNPFHVDPSGSDFDDYGFDGFDFDFDFDFEDDVWEILTGLRRGHSRFRGGSGASRGLDPRKVHIFGMSLSTGSLDVQRAFSAFGTVTDVFIMRDKRTRVSLGKGFVTFSSVEAYASAVAARQINVQGRCVGIRPAYAR
jgi:curved DNA-binding protein CbpA